MVKAELVRAEAARNGMSVAGLARQIGIPPATLYRKLKSGILNSDEIESIVRVCGTEDPMPIFFPEMLRQA